MNVATFINYFFIFLSFEEILNHPYLYEQVANHH